jgi:hypothetical protein
VVLPNARLVLAVVRPQPCSLDQLGVGTTQSVAKDGHPLCDSPPPYPSHLFSWRRGDADSHLLLIACYTLPYLAQGSGPCLALGLAITCISNIHCTKDRKDLTRKNLRSL